MFLRNGSGGIILSHFANEVVTDNSILVKYTYNGDFNLSGSVDADDYSLIDTGFANALPGMQNGDINLSGGPPDADDYALIDFAFATQSGPLAVSTPLELGDSASITPAKAVRSAGRSRHRHHIGPLFRD
jgi:hypothetical protein